MIDRSAAPSGVLATAREAETRAVVVAAPTRREAGNARDYAKTASEMARASGVHRFLAQI